MGSDLIIYDKEYTSLETVVMAPELVPTSKRLLGSDTSQGNTDLSRLWTVPNKYNLTNSYLTGVGLPNIQSTERGLPLVLDSRIS